MLGMDFLTYVVEENTFLEKLYTGIHSRKIYKKLEKFIARLERNKAIKKVYTKWYTFFDELIVKKMEIKADNDHRDWIEKFSANTEKCISRMK
jgi:hypothetical protein